MGNIDKSALTTEQLMMAIKCKTADELIALAKSGGFDMTKEEAEAYIAEMSDVELDDEALAKVAGGSLLQRLHQGQLDPVVGSRPV